MPFDMDAASDLLRVVKRDEALSQEALLDWTSAVDYLGAEVPPNWGSWQQLQYFLYTPMGLNLPPALYWKKGRTGWVERDDGEYIEEWTDEGEFKTDDVALSWLGKRHPQYADCLGAIQDLRWQQRVRTYLETWLGLAVRHAGPHGQAWHWLHPSFGLASDRDERAGARTGRFAVKNPALQQVPVRGDNYGLRRLFRAPPGSEWVVLDYSQLEVVILAHICNKLFGTDDLVKRCRPGQPDMHSLTAKYVFGDILGDARLKAMDVGDIKKQASTERDLVKAVRYGLNYGKGARGFGDTLFDTKGEALGEEKAQTVIDALLDFDPEIRQYQAWSRERVVEWRGAVSLLGRFSPLPDATSWKKGERNRAYRQFLNYAMQAGGQEVTALGMIAAAPLMAAINAPQILQVHDENCFLAEAGQGGEAKKVALEAMLNCVELAAPLGASGGVGPSWGEAKH